MEKNPEVEEKVILKLLSFLKYMKEDKLWKKKILLVQIL